MWTEELHPIEQAVGAKIPGPGSIVYPCITWTRNAPFGKLPAARKDEGEPDG
jgi:hypothetical protein